MKLLNCLIVDDDLTLVESLKEQLQKLNFIQVVGHCSSYGEAILALKDHAIDFILLDVHLADNEEGLSGFDLLQHNSLIPPVIIMSSAPENAIESYRIGIAKDFLVKPFTTQRLLLAINRVLNRSELPNQIFDDNSIFFKIGRKFQRFNLDNIDYFEGYGIYTKVFCDGDITVINESLATLEGMLNAKNFIRVHKSYIVNLNRLVSFDHNRLFLRKGQVPIGISYKSKLEVLMKLFDDTTD